MAALRSIFVVEKTSRTSPTERTCCLSGQKAPRDSLILTLGCGKFRFNREDLGDINGIPRVLDVGQCNDAYSAIQIAIAVANALGCGGSYNRFGYCDKKTDQLLAEAAATTDPARRAAKYAEMQKYVSDNPPGIWLYYPKEIRAINNGSLRINGGFFIFKSRIFDFVRPKEELVLEPFQRLIAEQQLIGYPYDGFWTSMDTFKDKQHLESLYSTGAAPWEVWKTNSNQGPMSSVRSEVACVA